VLPRGGRLHGLEDSPGPSKFPNEAKRSAYQAHPRQAWLLNKAESKQAQAATLGFKCIVGANEIRTVFERRQHWISWSPRHHRICTPNIRTRPRLRASSHPTEGRPESPYSALQPALPEGGSIAASPSGSVPGRAGGKSSWSISAALAGARPREGSGAGGEGRGEGRGINPSQEGQLS